MDRKKIQRSRMMNYFIEAAKDIIKEEGIESLSVRKVGDRAGYSYATIYNYFKDLNTLLYYCLLDYMDECYNYLKENIKGTKEFGKRIEVIAASYVEYFAKNPYQFQLIFIEDLGEPPLELLERLYKPLVAVFVYEEIMEHAAKANIKPEDAKILNDLIDSSIHGKLLAYIKGRNQIDVDSLIKDIKAEVGFLIDKLR